MRNIMQARRGHKPETALALLLIPLALAVAGCGGGESGAEADVAPAEAVATDGPHANASARDGSIVLRTSALDAWTALARNLREKRTVRLGEYERILTLPAYTMIYGEDETNEMNPLILRNVMTHLFGEGGGRTPKRLDLLNNYTYLARRFDDLDALCGRLREGTLLADALERVRPYLPASSIPDGVIVDLYAAVPSITWYPDGVIVIDAGLALAAGDEQLERLLAASLVRSLGPTAGAVPHETSGREALRATFRKLHHESVIHWIESYPDLVLDESHPTFAIDNSRSRLRAVTDSAPLLSRIDAMLPTLLDPTSDAVEGAGGSIDDLLRLGKRYEALGYSMAALCVDVFGETRFQEAVRQGPSAWLELYQEAAGSGRGSGDLGLLPAFADDTVNALRELPLR